ncbi:hypothetical protein BDQ17DRAFT_1491499 [Cyathus striatus]|nr:hypothetical protein BDQ17DRAFT_1491499 [Cyathus striatus]
MPKVVTKGTEVLSLAYVNMFYVKFAPLYLCLFRPVKKILTPRSIEYLSGTSFFGKTWSDIMMLTKQDEEEALKKVKEELAGIDGWFKVLVRKGASWLGRNLCLQTLRLRDVKIGLPGRCRTALSRGVSCVESAARGLGREGTKTALKKNFKGFWAAVTSVQGGYDEGTGVVNHDHAEIQGTVTHVDTAIEIMGSGKEQPISIAEQEVAVKAAKQDGIILLALGMNSAQIIGHWNGKEMKDRMTLWCAHDEAGGSARDLEETKEDTVLP